MVLTVFLILLALVALTLFLIAPSPTGRAESWRGTLFAHRGLHGNGVAENTLPAFDRACRAGYGIELDVQLSRDGAVMVFHDDDLKRMTQDGRRVDEVDRAELQSMSLPGDGSIPTFAEALALIDGRAPLLVELKNGRQNRKLCEDTLKLLRAYPGKYLVESFNPLILRWFRRNAPDVIRGQLVGARPAYIASHFGMAGALALSTLSLNFLARPDFVAYDVSAEHFTAPKIQRALFRTPMAAWTVRDAKTCAQCLSRGEMPIFEGFLPEKGT